MGLSLGDDNKLLYILCDTLLNVNGDISGVRLLQNAMYIFPEKTGGGGRQYDQRDICRRILHGHCYICELGLWHLFARSPGRRRRGDGVTLAPSCVVTYAPHVRATITSRARQAHNGRCQQAADSLSAKR